MPHPSRLTELNDPVLTPLVAACDEPTRRAAVEALVERAGGVIDAVLSRYRSTLPDLEEVRATIVLSLLRRLRDVPLSEAAAIERFEDFVARTAYNAANDRFRELFPARARLKNRVRYLAGHSARLASWRSGREVAVGLPAWRDRPPLTLAPRPEALPRELEAAMVLLVERAGGPLLVDSIVEALASAWNLRESQAVPLATALPVVEESGDARHDLAALWKEIVALPAKQRAALLLNLRDDASTSAVELFIVLGIASIDDVAAALEMSAAELARLWNALPLDDNTLSEKLGVTRQQVINLRRAARERLTRRSRRRLGR